MGQQCEPTPSAGKTLVVSGLRLQQTCLQQFLAVADTIHSSWFLYRWGRWGLEPSPMIESHSEPLPSIFSIFRGVHEHLSPQSPPPSCLVCSSSRPIWAPLSSFSKAQRFFCFSFFRETLRKKKKTWQAGKGRINGGLNEKTIYTV